MKKLALAMALVMMLSVFAACGNDAAETTVATAEPTDAMTEGVIDGSDAEIEMPEADPELSALFAKLYEEVPVELMIGDIPVDLKDPVSLSSFVGTESADGIEAALASEAMMGAQAYSITLVRAENEEAAAKLAKTMFDGVNTRKWICVEATDKQAASYGNLAVFIMVDPELGVTSEQLMQGFATVFGGEITNIIK